MVDRNNFTQIPNIIRHLTYTCPKTGKSKRLTVLDITLYMLYREICNDDGICWKSNQNLADESGMCRRSMMYSKNVLLQPFHQLDGNPLIISEECRKPVMNNGKKVSASNVSKVTLVNVWTYNELFASEKKEAKKQSYEQAQCTECTMHIGTVHGMHHASTGGTVHHMHTNKKNNKNPLFKEQQPPAKPVLIVSSNQKKRLFPSDAHAKIYNWLLYELPESERAKEHTAFDIATKFDPCEVALAADYIKCIMNRYFIKHHIQKVFSSGYVAYLRNTLNNKDYEKGNE